MNVIAVNAVGEQLQCRDIDIQQKRLKAAKSLGSTDVIDSTKINPSCHPEASETKRLCP